MNYPKILGLAVLAMASIAAFAGSASATTLTSPAGTTVPGGTKFKASSGGILTEGELSITCNNSVLEGLLENPGSEMSTVRIGLTEWTLTECGNHTLTVVKRGDLEIHTDTASADGNGTVTSTGAEITTLTHNVFLGTMHCIGFTENTHFGTLTGSKNREGKTAELNLEVTEVPAKETHALCEETLTLTGIYKFNTPDYLDVD